MIRVRGYYLPNTKVKSRNLALSAAEQGVSLNRLAIAKLAVVPPSGGPPAVEESNITFLYAN